jgi:hypothetical protein
MSRVTYLLHVEESLGVYNHLNPLNLPDIGADFKKTNLNEIPLVDFLKRRGHGAETTPDTPLRCHDSRPAPNVSMH